MNDSRRVIIKKVIYLIIIISPLTIFLGFYLNTWKFTPIPDTAWVSWYGNPQNEVYIGWETAENTIGTIKYGTQEDNLDNEIKEPSAVKFHTVNLIGLAPNTKYYYEIEIDGDSYTQGEFRTAPSTYEPFTFGLIADTQQKFGPGWHQHTANILDSKDYSFLALIGDFVEDGEKYEWNDFFTCASTYLDTIPFIPVRGNHDRPRDLDGDGDEEYYFEKYFPQTVDIEIGKNKYDTWKQFYFSFDYGSVHFQILNVPEVDIDDEGETGGVSLKDYYQTFTEDHLDWIKQDLKDAQSMPFRVTMFHCPITGAGFYGPNFVIMDELLPILHEYKVTATIHGHSHHFERGTLINEIHPQNPLTYFIVGCGGGLADVGLRPVNETEVAIASPCYTEGHATEDTLTFTTYTFEGLEVDKITFRA